MKSISLLKEMNTSKAKLLSQKRKKKRFKKRRTNLKLKELLLSYSQLLKKLPQNHSKKIMELNGITEPELMLPEVKLLRQLLPKMLKNQKMLVRTKILLPKLLMLLPLLLTLTLEIEKVLLLTHGMNNGSPRLFLNQMVMPIALTDN